MWIIKYKNIFFGISALLVVLSVVVIAVWGLPQGVDFSGGSIVSVTYDDPPTGNDIEAALAAFGGGVVRTAGESGYIVRTRFLSEQEQAELLDALSFGQTRAFTIDRLSSVGPSIGSELRRKAFWAIGLVIVMIILYVAFAFRGVAAPREGSSTTLAAGRGQGPTSWKYGLVAIIALLHDVLIPTGVFAILGRFAGFEVDVLFVTALLAILGFSVNDTIVVFDRIRENLRINEERRQSEPFRDVVGRSLMQTLARSINTSLTVFLVLLLLLVLAGPTVKTFAVTMLVGVVAGSYSSIFLASPLLLLFAKNKGN